MEDENMEDEELKKYGKAVECAQCKTGFMDRNITPVVCHGLIFCNRNCCRCAHCGEELALQPPPVTRCGRIFCSLDCSVACFRDCDWQEVEDNKLGCYTYVPYVPHRWAYIPKDEGWIPGQIDCEDGKGRGKDKGSRARVAGAGAGAGAMNLSAFERGDYAAWSREHSEE